MADELVRDLMLRCSCSSEQRLSCLSCRAVAEIERLRAMIREYVAAETASRPPGDIEAYSQWEQRAGDAWDILVEEARRG